MEPTIEEANIAIKDELPKSFADGLNHIAKFLDLADAIIELYGQEHDFVYRANDQIQTDLRDVATWIEAHPQATLYQLNDYFLSLLVDADI